MEFDLKDSAERVRKQWEASRKPKGLVRRLAGSAVDFVVLGPVLWATSRAFRTKTGRGKLELIDALEKQVVPLIPGALQTVRERAARQAFQESLTQEARETISCFLAHENELSFKLGMPDEKGFLFLQADTALGEVDVQVGPSGRFLVALEFHADHRNDSGATEPDPWIGGINEVAEAMERIAFHLCPRNSEEMH